MRSGKVNTGIDRFCPKIFRFQERRGSMKKKYVSVMVLAALLGAQCYAGGESRYC